MIKVGIIGSTGYAGAELVRLLWQHPQAEIVWYGSRTYADQKYASVYRNMFELVDETCMNENMDELSSISVFGPSVFPLSIPLIKYFKIFMQF